MTAHTPDGGGLTEAEREALDLAFIDAKVGSTKALFYAAERIKADAYAAGLAARTAPDTEAVAAEVVTEWGARYEDGSVLSCGWMQGVSERFADNAMKPDLRRVAPPSPAVAIVTRQRTIYADTVTEWQDHRRAAGVREGREG